MLSEPPLLDDIIFCLEFDDGTLSRGSLLAQFSQPVLQPNAGLARHLKLSLQLINNISICNRVGDIRGAFGIQRCKADLNYVAGANSLHRQPICEHRRGAPRTFVFGFGRCRDK